MLEGLRVRPSWLVAATVLSVAIPWGDGAVGSGTTRVSPGDVASLLLVVLAGAFWVRDRAAGRVRVPVAVALVFAGIVVAAALSTELSADPASSLVGWVRQTQIFVLVPPAVIVSLRVRRDVSIVVGSIVTLGVVEAGVGVWQTATRNGASYAGQMIRAVGTFGALDVMAMSIVCGIALVMAVPLALTAPDGWRRALFLGVTAVLVVGLVCSLSRGSWIAAGAGVLVVLMRFDAKLAFRLGLGAGALLTVVMGGFGVGAGMIGGRVRSILDSVHDPDRSVGDRYSLWRTAEGMWQDHPATGVGIKNFPAFRDAYAPLGLSGSSDTADSVTGFVREPLLSPHNQYLLALSEQGVLGAGAFVLALGALLIGLWRRGRAADAHWLLCVGVATSVCVNFLYSDVGGPTTVLVGIVLGLATRHTWPVASADGEGER